MTLPTNVVINGARKAASRMATRKTPFIFNEWYVAAYAEDVTREMMARTILGKRLVFFRKEDGTPVALADRCAHRSFPLSKGHLDGDAVICAYHGFRFNAKGDLVEVPSQPKCPQGIGVKNYKVVEKGPLLWIWMGEYDEADESKLPHQEWITAPDWICTKGYFHHPGNYVSMHENLMDLTHLSFLHAKTIGTPDYAGADYGITLEEGHYKLVRDIVPTTLPPVWGRTTKIEGENEAARIATSEFLSPGLHRVSVTFYNVTVPEAERREFHIRTAHILTPETENTMHYHIVHGRDFAQDDQWVTDFMHEGLFAAFQEDVIGLGALEEVLDSTDEDDMYEVSVAADAPAVAMRIYLKDRANKEAAAKAGDSCEKSA